MQTFNIAIIGTGLMAEIYADILSQRGDCHLVAVCGNTKTKTDSFAKRYSIQGYSDGDVEAMFAKHSEVGVTVIATPEWEREKPLEEAIKNKQHILLEKPFAHDYKTALKLEKMLSGYENIFQICHVLRSSPRFRALKNAIDQHQIGDLRHIYARRNSNLMRVQRVLNKTDLAFWLTPHDVDIMRWITGSEVVEVFARSRNNLNDSDDYLIANLRFANKVDAVLEISWCTPPISGVAPEAKFEVWGTNGSAEVADFDMNVRIYGKDGVVLSPDTYEDFEIEGLRTGYFKNMIDVFIKKIRENMFMENNNNIKGAVETINICNMIRDSINQKKIISR